MKNIANASAYLIAEALAIYVLYFISFLACYFSF